MPVTLNSLTLCSILLIVTGAAVGIVGIFLDVMYGAQSLFLMSSAILLVILGFVFPLMGGQ